MTAVTMRRMTQATWYKHRVSVVGIPAVFLLAALALFADGAVQRHWLSVRHLNGCLVASDTTGGSWCVSSAAWASFSSPSQTPNIIAVAVLALPALVGLFAGVPWVAREFESGAFRFTWTQGIGPRHWLLGTFGPLVLLAAASAAIYGAAADWWYQLAQWQDGTSIWSWRWSSFELTPLSIAGWTVLTMALALLCGVLIRRVVPAMIAFIVTLGACTYLSQTWLRPWLFGIGTAVKQVSWSTSAGWPPSTTTYTVQTWLQTPSGQRVSGLPAADNVSAWIAQHHYTSWVAYQPHSHLIWLELARNGILITVAAFAVLASVWWLRIRPAD
jgi:hypothetical protein